MIFVALWALLAHSTWAHSVMNPRQPSTTNSAQLSPRRTARDNDDDARSDDGVEWLQDEDMPVFFNSPSQILSSLYLSAASALQRPRQLLALGASMLLCLFFKHTLAHFLAPQALPCALTVERRT